MSDVASDTYLAFEWSAALVLTSKMAAACIEGQGPHRRRAMTGLLAAIATAGVLQGCSKATEILVPIKLHFSLKGNGVSLRRAGVWLLSFRKMSVFPNPGWQMVTDLRGDAIPLGTDGGSSLFALLVTNGGETLSSPSSELPIWDCLRLLHVAYGVDVSWVGGDSPGLRSLVAQAPTPLIEVPISDYPSIIAFTNPDRPETGRLVDPRDLAGGGLRIERLEIQVVDEPVDRGSVAVLPWFTPGERFVPDIPKWNDFRRHPEYFSR